MKQTFRGFGLLSVSASVLLLAACGTTGNANMANVAEANRVDSILARAAAEAKASGDKVETLTLLEQVYNRNQNDAAVATSFAQALREDEQLNRARQVVYPFTEGKNAYPDAVIELSMIQLALGQYKESELTSRRAVEMAPEQGRAYLALGTALDAQNYHEQAEVAFRRGLEKWKGDPAPILNNLALNLASQNKLDQAIDMLKKAQEISPGRVEIERNMRIITTLKEGADDFLVKQGEDKEGHPVKAAAPAAKADAEAAPAKTDDKAAAKTPPKKDETVKDAEAKPVAKPAPAAKTTTPPKKPVPVKAPAPETNG